MAEEITVVLQGRDESLGRTMSEGARSIGGVGEAAQTASKNFDDIGNKADASTPRVGGFSSALGGVSTIASGFVIGQGLAAAPAFFKGLSDQAAALDLQATKANTVFGDQIGTVRSWAEENATSMGLTTSQATTLAASLGDLLIPMGMTREEAAALSTKTVGLAGALSEWSGGTKSAAEVSDILTKAYLGETDGLKSLGIAISAADVSQRLLEKGQDGLTGSAMQQAQALAIQEMIFEKSTDAQNAFANGSDSAARKQAEMRARMAEAREELAVALAPAFTNITMLLTTIAIPAFQALGPTLDAISTAIGFVMDNFEVFGPAIAVTGAVILGALIPAFIAWAVAAWAAAAPTIVAAAPLIALGVAVFAVSAAIAYMVTHWDTITAKIPFLGAAVTAVKDVVVGGIDLLTGAFQAALDWVTANWPLIATIIAGPFAPLVLLATDAFGVRSALEGAFSAALAFVTGMVGSIAGVVGGLAGTLLGAVGDLLSAGTSMGTAIKDGIVGGIKGIFDSVGEISGDIREAFKSAINSAMKWLRDNVKISIPGFDPPGPGSIPGWSWSFPYIAFNQGGIVPGPRGMGDVVPAMLTPGELVVPASIVDALSSGSRSLGGGSSFMVNFNGPVKIDDPRQMRRRAEDFGWMLQQTLRTRGVAV